MTICLISIFCAFMISCDSGACDQSEKKTVLAHHLLKFRLNKMIITQSSSEIIYQFKQ